jgi:hypothetical protein
MYESISKSFRTGCLERELQMIELSATRCNCVAILRVNVVSFAAITFCVASQRVFIVVIVYFIMTQSGNFWIHSRIIMYRREGELSSMSLAFRRYPLRVSARALPVLVLLVVFLIPCIGMSKAQHQCWRTVLSFLFFPKL